MKYWRFTDCRGTGGLVIARTKRGAIRKLKAKYGAKAAATAEVWEWKKDDYFDSEHPDVFNIYDC